MMRIWGLTLLMLALCCLGCQTIVVRLLQIKPYIFAVEILLFKFIDFFFRIVLNLIPSLEVLIVNEFSILSYELLICSYQRWGDNLFFIMLIMMGAIFTFFSSIMRNETSSDLDRAVFSGELHRVAN
jgi:hypothetical protein